MRKALLLAAVAALPGATAAPASAPQAIVIAGGTIYDGSSTTPVTGDVVIIGDKIISVGPGAGKKYPGAKRVDAKGLIVSPGFIDPHTHADGFLRAPDAATLAAPPFSTTFKLVAAPTKTGAVFGGVMLDSLMSSRAICSGMPFELLIFTRAKPPRSTFTTKPICWG